MLAPLLFLASSVVVTAPRIENAVTIHTAGRDYLEFDIAPLSPCLHPNIMGMTLRGSRTAVVNWAVPGSVVDTTCTENATRANVILPFPDSVGGPHGAFLADTVTTGWSGVFVTNIGRVTNPAMPVMCPMIACLAPDSATALHQARARIQASSFVATFAPYYQESFVAISPWSKTNGTENFPEVVVPLPGNAGNWIDEEVVQLAMDSIVSGKFTSPCSTGVVCPLYLVRPMVTLPTGPVQYVYQQAADPFNADTSRAGTSFVQDSVFKMGSRLHLSGYISHPCWRPLVDSELIKETLWLVASGGSGADSLKLAFQQPAYCSGPRPGAWPMRDGKVEITTGVWVPLADLVGASGILPAKARAGGPSLRRVGQVASLELPVAACVRAIDVSGREILPSTAFAAGRHSLRLPGRGMLFVQVRSGMSTVTFPLEPAP